MLELKQSLAEAEDEADALYMSGTQTLSIEQLRRNVTDAQQAYDTAKQSLDAAKKAVMTSLVHMKQSSQLQRMPITTP